jgi:hypothetical protein
MNFFQKANLSRTWCKPKDPFYINGANSDTGFVEVPGPLQLHRRRGLHLRPTSMLFFRRLPPKEAWLLVFLDGILTADFIRVSVAEVEMMIRMRPTVA